MRDILKACKFSGAFNNEAIINIQPEDPRSEDLKNNTWVSEEMSQEQIKNVPIEDQLYTELIEKLHEFKEIYDQGIRGLDKSLTITRHSSVYDISNKSVTIYIDENYNNAYKYDCN